MDVKVKICAKLNLSLNITGTAGGYHILDSIVTSVSVYDVITVRARNDDKIDFTFNADFVPVNNTAIKAVNELRKIFGNFGADIVVDKHIPLAGGMGGSSADAAGVIAALSYLYKFDSYEICLKKLCSNVGSDVFYMLKGGFARMKGRGDEITYLSCDKKIGLVYICSDGVDTAKVYAEFDKLGGDEPVDNEKIINMLNGAEKSDFFATNNPYRYSQIPIGNMLTKAAIGLNGRILDNMEALKKIGLTPNMTGSGSTVYALSADPEGDRARLVAMGYNAFSAYTCARGLEIE